MKGIPRVSASDNFLTKWFDTFVVRVD